MNNMFEYRCVILRIIDGDTADVDIDCGFGIWLRKQRIRFYGIDTPESRTRDLEEKKYGLMAKEIVKRWIPEGSTQTLITEKDDKGKYGRILGKFKITFKEKETTLNEWMITNHYGVEYFGQSKEEIEEEHIRNRELVNSDMSKLFNLH
jgi:micrococcal nuclease